MSPYTRAALFLIRMVAFGLILVGLLTVGLHIMAVKQGKTAAVGGIFFLILKILSFLVGSVLLIKSGAIARKLTEDLE